MWRWGFLGCGLSDIGDDPAGSWGQPSPIQPSVQSGGSHVSTGQKMGSQGDLCPLPMQLGHFFRLPTLPIPLPQAPDSLDLWFLMKNSLSRSLQVFSLT